MWVSDTGDSDEDLMLTEIATLTNICLNSICQNIDRFHAAFHISRDEEMKENLFLLRRLFSNQIIKMLMDPIGDKTLDKKYFDLLINEYLKELDFCIFGEKDLDIILEMLPKIGNNLEKVSFDFNPMDFYRFPYDKFRLEQFVKKALQHLPHVKVLVLVHGHNKTLEIIYNSCKQLKELYLKRCLITNAGLKSLCPEDKMVVKALNLQTLSLEFIRDCDEGVSYLLKNLPSLECIAYENLPNVLHKLHADDLRNNSLHNVPKYNLTSLHIDEMINFQGNTKTFEETLEIAAELCPRISKILVNNIMTEEHFQILCRFSNLSDVSIQGEDEDLLDVSDFFQHSGKKIKHLKMKNFVLNLSTVVENCPILESVRLDTIDYCISDKEKSITTLKNMRKLILVHIDAITGSSEIIIKLLLDSCPNLNELQFLGCDEQMSGVIQKYCEESQTLEKLTFLSCAVEEALLQQIVLTCTPLKKLIIGICENINPDVIYNLRDIIRARERGVVVDFVYKDSSDGEIDYLDDENVYDLFDDI